MSKKKAKLEILDPLITEEDLQKAEDGDYGSDLIKSIVSSINTNKKVTRLSFQEDPSSNSRYAGLYYEKNTSLPDSIIKRISIVNDLVAAIVHARANHARPYGERLQDRFSTGFRIEPKFKDSNFEQLPPEKRAEILKKAEALENKLLNCGSVKNTEIEDAMSLSTFLYISAANAVKFGRFATEIIWAVNEKGEQYPHSFRPSDPATILKAVPHADQGDGIRQQALKKLQELKKEKIDPNRFIHDDYSWFQVINGTPEQAFTSKEMVVYNCYPVTDIELNGYPLTPIDTAIAAITTHINITNHNKLYFQSGRASKGMLVINSDEVDQGTLQDLKQQFNAAINSVSNAWRMPVIKTGKDDKVVWSPIDSGSRDMEFQYLSDDTKRVILAAFQISPDELPGYSHLSKGTNNQALSESSNEYKLEAARDVGIRPLLANLQDFLNSRILPVFDPEVAKYCQLRLHGLDAETAEKENTRIQEEQQLHETYNGILRRVEKEVVPKEMGGDLPLSPAYQGILDKYLTVGEIKEYFFGIKGAAKRPEDAYRRDPFYFQQIQLIQQQQMQQQQQQLAQQQLQMQQQGQNQLQDPTGGGDSKDKKPDDKPKADSAPQTEQADSGIQDLQSGIDQVLQHISKSEADLTINKKKLLAQHQETVKSIMDLWHKESEKALSEIANVVDKNKKGK